MPMNESCMMTENKKIIETILDENYKNLSFEEQMKSLHQSKKDFWEAVDEYDRFLEETKNEII